MKFVPHKDPVLLVVKAGTLAFSCEDELVDHMLKTVPLEALLLEVQNRTSQFVGHKKALDRLKELVDGIIAANVADALTASPPLIFSKSNMYCDDRLDKVKFLASRFADVKVRNDNFGLLMIDGL